MKETGERKHHKSPDCISDQESQPETQAGYERQGGLVYRQISIQHIPAARLHARLTNDATAATRGSNHKDRTPEPRSSA